MCSDGYVLFSRSAQVSRQTGSKWAVIISSVGGVATYWARSAYTQLVLRYLIKMDGLALRFSLNGQLIPGNLSDGHWWFICKTRALTAIMVQQSESRKLLPECLTRVALLPPGCSWDDCSPGEVKRRTVQPFPQHQNLEEDHSDHHDRCLYLWLYYNSE